MLWNPGQLPHDWTVERLLQKYSSQPFNPDIANVFFRAGLIESWGRGIEKIVSACATAKQPAPEIRFESTGLWITFPFAKQTGQVTGQVTGQIKNERLPWVVEVLQACVSAPVKSSEIQSIVGIKHRETFQRNYLDYLIDQHLLERTIPDKLKSRLQKYRQTATGLALPQMASANPAR